MRIYCNMIRCILSCLAHSMADLVSKKVCQQCGWFFMSDKHRALLACGGQPLREDVYSTTCIHICAFAFLALVYAT